MAQRSLILRYLRRTLADPASDAVGDAELLRRFVVGRDEAAFELLLWRHAAMVLGLCRALLHHEQDAEDAFQATFLTLARRGHAIRRGESLAGWLYRVGYRVALRVRTKAARRDARAMASLDPSELLAVARADEPELRELRQLLHQEVQRLPAKYRQLVVLCYLEGLTHAEAAQQLGWPRGTVAGRLARARVLLRRRLVRRGLAPSAALCAAALSSSASAAPPELLRATARAGALIAAGQSATGAVSPRVISLTEGVLRTMFWAKVRIAAVALVAVALLGGAGLAVGGRLAAQALVPRPGAADESSRGQPGAGPARDDSRALVASQNNLKQIALAMHKYNDAKGTLPPAALMRGGRPLLSWRVLLLPYLGQGELCKQFKLDQPWDSPHNRKLLARMPAVYRTPGARPGTTFYQVFVGQGTAFEPGRHRPVGGSGMGGGSNSTAGWIGSATLMKGAAPSAGLRIPADFPDGTSNILLVVEAGQAVPWTKPEDLPYAPTGQLPPLGGPFRSVINAALVDGAVIVLKRAFRETAMRRAIERNDGENWDRDDLIASVPNRNDSAALRKENTQLRKSVREAQDEVRRLRQDWLDERARAKRRPEQDKEAEQLRREQRALREELGRAREEAAQLREQIERLRKSGKGPRQDEKRERQ